MGAVTYFHYLHCIYCIQLSLAMMVRTLLAFLNVVVVFGQMQKKLEQLRICVQLGLYECT